MHEVAVPYGPPNITRLYSPVSLNYEWPTLERLILMVCCSCFGTTINGFFVASFFVEHTLNRLGNVFLACVGLSDLIVSTAVMPVSAVVLLSASEWDMLPICRALQFLTEVSTYSYSLFFLLVSAESYYRLCRPSPEYDVFLKMRIGLVSFCIYMFSVIMAAIGVFLNYDYDYCERIHHGDFTYRVTTSFILHGMPSVFTILGFIVSFYHIRKRARERVFYKRLKQYDIDLTNNYLNLAAFIIYILMWTPYLIVVHEYPDTSDSKFYNCVWIGVSRSIFSSVLYCSMSRIFRRAFAHLFCYCCCKSTLTGSFSNRHRRALDFKSTTGKTRVHIIMHQVVNAGTSQRGASTSRDTQQL